MEQILKSKEQDAKPCPFCGNTVISVVQRYETGKYFIDKGFSIGCQSIGCFGCHSYARSFKTSQEAIDAWNRRTIIQNHPKENDNEK